MARLKAKTPPTTGGQNSKSSSASSKQVKRMLLFENEAKDQQEKTLECVNLLRAMGLDEEEDPEGGTEAELVLGDKEDEATCQLLEEWVFEITEERVGLGSVALKEVDMEVDLDLSSFGEERSSNSTSHSLVGSGEEGSKITLMTQDKRNQDQEQIEQRKGKGKKNQWGPTIPLRRISRHTKDARLMMEKAQDAKRKWNLDDKTGKNTKISKPLLIYVAKEIGLVNLDGNPEDIDSMLDLDSSRTAASQLNRKVSSCGSMHGVEKK